MRPVQYRHEISCVAPGSIEALRSAWLFELWCQQSFLGGAVDVRLGQLAADQEFMITQYGNWLVNAASGWPTLPSANLPAGGPNLPLATPAVRLRVKPSGPLTLLFAAFNGDPAGPGLGNPQRRDPSGTLFRLGDGVFAIAEAQYAINGDKDAKGPPITLKVGGWYHDKATPNQFFATNGLTITPAAGAGSAIARENWSAYAVADAMLLPAPGGTGGLAAFARRRVAARAQRGQPRAGRRPRLCRAVRPRRRPGRPCRNLRPRRPGARRRGACDTVRPPRQRDGDRIELPGPGAALAASATGLPIRRHARRRHPRPEPAGPARWQRRRVRPAHRRSFLTLRELPPPFRIPAQAQSGQAGAAAAQTARRSSQQRRRQRANGALVPCRPLTKSAETRSAWQTSGPHGIGHRPAAWAECPLREAV